AFFGFDGQFFATGASPSASGLGEVTNTRSPQMMGVDPLRDGSSTFHITFSVSDHLSGRPVESDVPLSDGPRHCGQLSFPTTGPPRTIEIPSARASLFMGESPVDLLG